MADELVGSREMALDAGKVMPKFQEIMAKILSLESAAAISPEAKLLDDLQLDSLGVVDMIIGIEETFGVSINSDVNILEQVETVADAVNLIVELAAKQR